MNRPEKRNAMSPALAAEMLAGARTRSRSTTAARCLVLTGAGDSFSAGMDLKEFFRETDGMSPPEREQIIRTNAQWQWRQLMFYPKPTIAMVNGWCFGGAFTPLVSCDLAIAAEEATFGLSEINWGIIPAGVVTKAVAQVMSQRDALYYIMTGETFDGRKAAAMGLVNEAVPLSDLRARTQSARQDAAGEESDRAARRQDRLPARARHVLGRRRRLSDGEERSGALCSTRNGPRAGHEAIPRRQELPARARRLQARWLRRHAGAAQARGPLDRAPAAAALGRDRRRLADAGLAGGERARQPGALRLRRRPASGRADPRARSTGGRA